MKRYFWCVVFCSLGVFSCNSEVKPLVEEDVVARKDSIHIEQATEKSTLDTIAKTLREDLVTGVPLPAFINGVKAMQNDGWYHDIARHKKVSYYQFLSDSKILYYDSIPFYRISFEESMLYKGKRYAEIYKDTFECVNFEFKEQVRSIWGYFYRGPTIENFTSDGIIEQWEFEAETHAQQVYNQMKRVFPIIYFNTAPWVFYHENYLFIFHTRAMSFSTDQKLVFEQLKSLMQF